MRIDAYFRQLEEIVRRNPLNDEPAIDYQTRSSTSGFVRGDLVFMDGSILHIREFVTVENGVNRQIYAYQYMSAEQALIFRYDNAPHHPEITTHPHHKHDGSEEHIVPSLAPTLVDVLKEIEGIVGWA